MHTTRSLDTLGTLPVTSLAAGVDLVIVSRDLGHSSTYFTADNYTQVPEEQSRLAAERVAEMYRVMRAHEAMRGGPRKAP